MLNQNDLKAKWQGIKGDVKHFLDRRFQKEQDPSNDSDKSQPDGVKKQAAQKMVDENENASLQDKSYSFDEDVTDADYDFEDSLDFQDEDSITDTDIDRYS